MATSLDKWKYATNPSSARNALSYGVKNAKIGAVDPEIFHENHGQTIYSMGITRLITLNFPEL